MWKFNWTGLLLLALVNAPVFAFSSVDEQIDHYLQVLDSGGYNSKIDMLKQLQWSGISDARLYDKMESHILEQYLIPDLDKRSIGVLSHEVRALGYSGNKKYRDTLARVQDSNAHRKLRGHAKKARRDLVDHVRWAELIANSTFSIQGKDAEVAAYMKMLSIDDAEVKRQGARAIFYGNQSDPDLLAMAAKQLQDLYLEPGLSADAQDAAAWLCKALGQSRTGEYIDLVTRVAAETPYEKIRRHAQEYAR